MLPNHNIMYLNELLALPFNRTCNGGHTSRCQNLSWIVAYFLIYSVGASFVTSTLTYLQDKVV